MLRQFAIALVLGAALGFGAAHALSRAEASPPKTEVIAENGVIRFIVNGQEQARIDATGLTTKGNLGYSGALIDSVSYVVDDAATTEGSP